MPIRLKARDFTGIQTTTLRDRPCRLNVESLAQTPDPGGTLQEFFSGLPRLGASAELLAAAQALTDAALAERGAIWLIDHHTIEAGLSPLIIRLIQRGLIRGILMNGTAAVCDYELAAHGATLEEVRPGLEDGLLGMSRETGEGLNAIVNEGVRRGFGLGECLGRGILDRKPRYYTKSILAACAARMAPCMIQVAIGSDGFHRHPLGDGALLGKGSLKDLQILAGLLPGLDRGGALVAATRVGAVRDVFYNAFSAAKNLGDSIEDFSCISLGDGVPDFDQLPGVKRHYTVPGPLELVLPLFTGIVFSLVE